MKNVYKKPVAVSFFGGHMPSQTTRILVRGCLLAAMALIAISSRSEAADWTVQKASGQVWVISAKAQPASLGKETALLPGDKLQTGPNGRVLLVRDEETILVAPNSVIGLPDEPAASGMTTILQQAGSIAVKAQKRDVHHFEVQTPYLAAVVKGTEFVVTLEPDVADVQVASGEVEVADFKSGQVASVMAGQAARSQGDLGLTLRGVGIFNLIRKSEPVKAILQLVNVPKNGLRAPLRQSGQVVRAIAVKVGHTLNGATKGAQQFARAVSSPFTGLMFWNPPREGRRRASH